MEMLIKIFWQVRRLCQAVHVHPVYSGGLDCCVLSLPVTDVSISSFVSDAWYSSKQSSNPANLQLGNSCTTHTDHLVQWMIQSSSAFFVYGFKYSYKYSYHSRYNPTSLQHTMSQWKKSVFGQFFRVSFTEKAVSVVKQVTFPDTPFILFKTEQKNKPVFCSNICQCLWHQLRSGTCSMSWYHSEFYAILKTNKHTCILSNRPNLKKFEKLAIVSRGSQIEVYLPLQVQHIRSKHTHSFAPYITFALLYSYLKHTHGDFFLR